MLGRTFATYHPKVAIVGAGVGGLSVCAQLVRQKVVEPQDIMMIEPHIEHAYHGYTTMIAGGFCGNSETSVQKYSRLLVRPLKGVLPKETVWLRDLVAQFDPGNSTLKTAGGHTISYKMLVLSPGLETNFASVEGAFQALSDPQSSVGSIYAGFPGAIKMNAIRQQITSGTAIFANAPAPAKCAGAPLKVCFMVEEYLRERKVREAVDVHFYCAGPSIFNVPEYAAKLLELMKERGIHAHFDHVLTAIDKDRKIAVFQNRKENRSVSVKYDYMHFAPKFNVWKTIIESGLADASGFIPVDNATLQHTVHKNIFALGDASTLPVNKTAAAITVQSPVLVHNIKRTLKGQAPNAAYNGYSVCPFFVGKNKMLFTESRFGYSYYSYFSDNYKSKWSFYMISRYLMPHFYWTLMPKGRWYGSRFIFPPHYEP